MARISAADLDRRVSGGDLARRIDAKAAPAEKPLNEPQPSPASAPQRPAPLSRKEQLSRRGLTFTGYYVNAQAKKQLRDLAYRTERDKQGLFREAMNLLFERYDMDPVHYDRD